MTTNEKGFHQDIADAVLRLPVAAAFGLTFTALADGRAPAELAWRPEHSHTAGAFQANPIAALADFTGVAAKFLTEARATTARALRPGTTLTVAAVDISVARNGTETLCAAILITMRDITNSARYGAGRRTPSDRARPSAQLPSGEPIPPLTRMPLHSPGEPAPGMQPTLNTAAETAGFVQSAPQGGDQSSLHPDICLLSRCRQD